MIQAIGIDVLISVLWAHLGGAVLLLVAALLLAIPCLLHQRIRAQQQVVLAGRGRVAQQTLRAAAAREQVRQPAKRLLALLAHVLQLFAERGIVHAQRAGGPTAFLAAAGSCCCCCW